MTRTLPTDETCTEVFGQVYALEVAGVTYVGKATGSSLSRWSSHIRMLKGGCHHCGELQAAFNVGGITSVMFRILRDRVPSDLLTHAEYEESERLGSINKRPGHVVRRLKARLILADIQGGIKYRDIAKKHGVSLGSIAKVKAQAHL